MEPLLEERSIEQKSRGLPALHGFGSTPFTDDRDRELQDHVPGLN